MLSIFLISGTFIATVLVHIIFKKKLRFESASYIYPVLFSLISLVGLVFIIWQQRVISGELVRRSWPTIQAEVIATRITGERAYNPELICRYHVNGSDYLLRTDLDTPPFGRKRTRKQTAEIIISEYPVGSAISVHYNPEQPEQACVRTGPFWNNYTVLMLGLILFGGGSLGLLSICFRQGAPLPHSGR